MTDPGSVLVFDGDCPFCSAASSALRHTRDVGVVPWSDETARALLEAQFGEVPFALVLVDGDEARLYVGREAARELCERAGLPVLVSDLLGENYESVAERVRAVSGADREPDARHGTFELTEAATERFPALAAAAEEPAARRHADTG